MDNETLKEKTVKVRSIDPNSLLWVYELLEKHVEEMKEELTIVRGDEFLCLQGAIKRVRVIMDDLRRKPSSKEKSEVGQLYS